MDKLVGKWNDVPIFEYKREHWEGKPKVDLLTMEGMVFRFYRWLRYYDLIDEYVTIDDVWNNLSELRDGCRMDIHDDYKLWDMENIEISFLYHINGNLWAVLYDKANKDWYGEIEIRGNV